MNTRFDAVVIGGGPGGYVCAERLAKYGLSTALVENRQLGGTCLNRGCIPTKVLLHAAETVEQAKKAAAFGISFENIRLDRACLLERKNEVTSSLRGGIAQLMKTAGVTVFEGTGFVPRPSTVIVTGPDGSVTELEAGDIVAAVGSVPTTLPIPGGGLPGVVTSDEILDELPDIKNLVIIGGGVIGVELASYYLAAGARVTILEGMQRLLPTMEKELGQNLSMIMKRAGAEIVTGAAVESITSENGTLTAHYSVKGKPGEAAGDTVLVAVGRRSLAPAVFAAELQVELDRGRAMVDGRMRSSVPHIYVIGDAAAGGAQLAHLASAQGLAAAAAIAGRTFDTRLDLVPGCVYTSPEIASVGLTESEARERGIAVLTAKYPMSANGKSRLTMQERGFIKLVCDDSGVLVGAQLMCVRATDMIGELALAIARGLDVSAVSSLIRPHPTFEEGIGDAAALLAAKHEK